MARWLTNKLFMTIQAKATWLLPGIATCAPQHKPTSLSAGTSNGCGCSANDPPKISVVIPSYNQGLFLERAVESLICQNYPGLEILVVDGGSTDGSREILERYSSHLDYWCSEPDRGQTNGLNKGFERSRGEIMGWLNSDDQLVPGALQRIAYFFSIHLDVDVVYGHRILINEDDMEIGRWTLPPHDSRVLNWADYIPQETLFWRRRLWNRIGAKLDERFQFAMDWDLLLRFRDAGAKMVRLPSFMGLFRVHERQKTCAEINSTGFDEMQRLRTRAIGYTPSPKRVALGVLWYMIKAKFTESLWKAKILRYD
jgi:glycosyltransferase involved in cell wall biosynthesis